MGWARNGAATNGRLSGKNVIGDAIVLHDAGDTFEMMSEYPTSLSTSTLTPSRDGSSVVSQDSIYG